MGAVVKKRTTRTPASKQNYFRWVFIQVVCDLALQLRVKVSHII